MFAFFQLDRNSARTFKLLAALSLLYVFPIILANYYYVDDWRRGMSGFAGWEFDGRPLTSRLMKLVSFGFPLLDVSPLSLILGILVLCYGLVLFSRNHIDKSRPFSTALALFFFVANPFFLENLSFKYDSLSMCLALFLMLFVFSLGDAIGLALVFTISTICIVATLNIYQPALCVFFCLLFIKFLFDIINKKSIRHIIISIGILLSSCLFALIIYKVTTVSYYFGSDNVQAGYWETFILDYARSHSSLITFKDIPLFVSNIGNFLKLINNYAKSVPTFLIVLSVILIFIFILFILNTFVKNYTDLGLSTKIFISLVVLFSPFLVFLNTFLFMSILYRPVFNCRIMIAFGAFMFLIGLAIHYISKPKHTKPANLLFVPLLLFVFVFSYSYGNTMNSQKNYDLVFLQKLSYDLGKIAIDNNESNILFVTTVGKSPRSKQMDLACSRFPIMKNLFYMYYYDGYPFFVLSLPNVMKYDYVRNMRHTEYDKRYISLNKPTITNDLYDIYTYNRKNALKIIINFDKSPVGDNLP